jgi:hypothetical protein
MPTGKLSEDFAPAGAGKRSKLSDLMTMDALSRKAHMNRQRVRDLCIQAGIAIRWGKRGVRARLSDFENVVLSCRVEQPIAGRRTVTRRRVLTGLHPDVNC